MMEQQPETKRKFSKKHCPHFNSYLSKSTWYCHYHEFYNQSFDLWVHCEHGESLDFVFDDSSLDESTNEINECDTYAGTLGEPGTSASEDFNFGHCETVCPL